MNRLACLLLGLIARGVPQETAPAKPQPARAAGSVLLIGEGAHVEATPPGPLLNVLLPVAARTPVALDARPYGGDDRTQWLVLPPPGAALEVALAAELRAAGSLALGPGDARAWWAAFYEGRKRRAAHLAIVQAYEQGAELVGRGLEAALLGRTLAISPLEDFGAFAHNPRARPRRPAPGLDLVPGMLETVARSHDDLIASLGALEQSREGWALVLAPRSVVRWSGPRARLEGVGDEAALVIDLRPARRVGGRWSGARAIRLGRGQLWSPWPCPPGKDADTAQASVSFGAGDLRATAVCEAVARVNSNAATDAPSSADAFATLRAFQERNAPDPRAAPCARLDVNVDAAGSR